MRGVVHSWPGCAALLAALVPGLWPVAPRAADGPVDVAGSSPATAAAPSNTPAVPLSEGWRFVERDGPALYAAICQGCHMADGRGAQGAASYPALAGNAKLASAAYVAQTVLRGRRAMPGFGRMLDDAQVAAVVNHVRSQYGPPGAGPAGPVTAGDVRPLR
jgi:mono/diheme cytochrome c family protein